MIGLLKRFRELILVAVLLVLPLGVYFAHVRHPSERSNVDRFVLRVTAPIERGISWALGGALRVWSGYIGLKGAQERASALTQELHQLRLERAELQAVREENARLGRLLAFAQEKSSWKVVGGRVVGVRLDPKGLQLLTIDRGARHGLARLMPVVVGQGVVGRLHSVSDASADVLVLTDRNSSIAVRVDRTRARANVRGTGLPDLCRIEYALRSDEMVEGDELVTSGTDGVFPRGLPVGKLVGVKRGGQGLYQRAEVDPAVDVTRLDEVLVLTDVGHDANPPAVAAEEPVGTTPPPAAASARPPAASPAARAEAPRPAPPCRPAISARRSAARLRPRRRGPPSQPSRATASRPGAVAPAAVPATPAPASSPRPHPR